MEKLALRIFNSLSDCYDDEESREDTVKELSASLEKAGSTIKAAFISLCSEIEELKF